MRVLGEAEKEVNSQIVQINRKKEEQTSQYQENLNGSQQLQEIDMRLQELDRERGTKVSEIQEIGNGLARQSENCAKSLQIIQEEVSDYSILICHRIKEQKKLCRNKRQI